MMKKFPVAWMTLILAILGSGDAVALYTEVLSKEQAAWVTTIVTLATLVLGKLTHSAVTPLADPKDSSGRRLVPSVRRDPMDLSK